MLKQTHLKMLKQNYKRTFGHFYVVTSTGEELSDGYELTDEVEVN